MQQEDFNTTLTKKIDSIVSAKTKRNLLIERDDMSVKVFDYDVWQKSQGQLTLNLHLLEYFLKNFYYILKKDKGPNASLNIAQVNLLNNFYGVNFNYFTNQKYIGKQFLNSALDFKDMFPLNLSIKPEDRISTTILKEFKNKIYQKKFMFVDLIQNLSILIRFKSFEFPLMFDSRGRAYPDTANFNYLDPIIKSFISWELRLPLKQELYPKVKALVKKQFDAVSKGKLILSDPKNLRH